IDGRTPWARKHLGTLRHFYGAASYTTKYLPDLEQVLASRWDRLVDLDLALIELICGWLGLHRPVARVSELGVGGGPTERLIALCRHFGAGRYLTGDAARDYLDVTAFAHHGIEVEWQQYHHPVYRQPHGEFLPYLSVLDLIFNCG